MNERSLLRTEDIESVILLVRGQKVILDAALARLYGVETRALIQAVKRNSERFPSDFMFRLTREEALRSRSRIVILDERCDRAIEPREAAAATSRRGTNLKYLPYAFTEHGVAMLSSVLRSSRAVQVNVEIMRAFVHLRQMLQRNADLARKLDALERKYDAQFKVVFDAIRGLMSTTDKPRCRIGFGRKAD